MRSHLLIVDLNFRANGFLIRKLFPHRYIIQGTAYFSSSRFTVSGFVVSHLIYLQGDRHGSNLIFLHMDFSFPSIICWRHCLFSCVCFQHLSWILDGCVYAHCYLCLQFYFTGPEACFFWLGGTFPYCFYYCGSVIFLRAGMAIFPALFLLLRFIFAILAHLWAHNNFRNFFFFSCFLFLWKVRLGLYVSLHQI